MKKLTAVFLSMVLMFSLSSCTFALSLPDGDNYDLRQYDMPDSISIYNSMNELYRNVSDDIPLLVIEDNDCIELFYNMIKNSERMPGILDVMPSPYVATLRYSSTVEVIDLYLSFPNEHGRVAYEGMYINHSESHFGFKFQKEDVEVFFQKYETELYDVFIEYLSREHIRPLHESDYLGHWAEQDIRLMIRKGIVSVYPDGNFYPDTNITRADFATFVSHLLPEPPSDYVFEKGGFLDVVMGLPHSAEPPYYTTPIYYLHDLGIVTGDENGFFHPQKEITREDIAVILNRFLIYVKYDKQVNDEYLFFADEDDISDYAKNAVQVLNKLGIIKGKGDNKIAPKDNATRAGVATMLARIFIVVENTQDSLLPSDKTTNELPGVTLTCKGNTLTSTGLTAIIDNNSENDLTFGEYYCIEKEIEGKWCQMPYIEQDYEVTWKGIGYIVSENAKYEFEPTNWEWLYGKLEAGKYRFIKDCSVGSGGDMKTYYFSTEFILSE